MNFTSYVCVIKKNLSASDWWKRWIQKQQEKPSRQQKSAKKDAESYLMFGLNYILVTLRRNYRRFLGHENACRWFLNRYKQLFGVSWKMFEMKFKFSKLVKSIVFRCLRTNKTVGCSEYSKRFVKENKKYLFKRSLNL